MPFKLKSLHIGRGYGKNDPFKATMSVANYCFSNTDAHCKMELQLDEAITLKIIELVAPTLVQAATCQISDFVQDARELGTQLIEHAPASAPELEMKDTEDGMSL